MLESPTLRPDPTRRPSYQRQHSHHSFRTSSPRPASPSLSSSPSIVNTQLSYFRLPPEGEKARWVMYRRQSESEPATNIFPEMYDAKVRDMRELKRGEYGMDKTGWDLAEMETKMEGEEWWDEEIIKSKYFKEVETFLQNYFNAKRVVIMTHLIRRNAPREGYTPGKTLVLPPSDKATMDPRAYQAHVDFSEGSANKSFSTHGVDSSKERAFICQVWQPLEGIAYDAPLAVVDWNSVDQDKDFASVETRYGMDKPTSEAFVVKHNPSHTWWYPSLQTPSELLLFKAYDTDPSKPGAIPHTAFRHPQYWGKEGVRKRENVEIRW